MSTTVTYKGSTLTTVNNQTRTLKTAGKYMEGDVTLVDVTSGGSTPTIESLTVTPSESQQTFNSSNVDGYKPVSVSAISSTYVGSEITRRSSTDLTTSGRTVYVPIGYYEEKAYKHIATGELAAPGYSLDNTTGKITITSSVSTEGYISSNYTISTTQQLVTQAGSTITPTESEQTAVAAGKYTLGAVKVGAISSTYVGSGITQRNSDDLTVSGAIVTAPAGYYAEAASKSVSSMTLPNAAASSATSGYTSKATIGRSTAAQYINIPPGYNSTGAYYVISAVANGSATAPSTISGTSATVSTGTNTLTLTKTVSVTPTVSAGYVSSGTAGNSSVSLTANVTTKAAATYHPSTTDQTISASQYLTGAQTIKAVTMTNLTAANIKKDVVVKIGDATDDDCVTTITGTYEGSSGGTGLTVDTSTTTLNSAAASISFTGLAGEPTSFAVVSAADLATGASPWKTAAIVFDGTDLHGQTIRNTSNAQVSYDGTAFSKTYSNGTLTITGSGTNFQANQYKLVYTYGGSDIGTADVQVGSGATTITFTGLSEEPSYFSCIFKSNFSTSSGYQRAIAVVYDGTSVYGLEMDSGAHYSDVHWSYTYSNGSLTITSQGTNAGGYFHQPGYYQLTYATEGESGNYQSKTVYATSSQQVVQADSGYDALKKVTIPAVTTTNLSASNILSGVTIQVGDAADSDRIASVTGNVVLQNYYTGSSAPSSSLGSNGDLYLQL